MKIKKLSSLPLLLLAASNSYASEKIKFSGFASVVAGQFSESEYQYAGYSNDLSFSEDSLFGLQIDANITDDISFTTQFVAKGINDFDVEAELAYLTYSINSNWDVRAGRIRTPFFYYSDFLDVGYAYPWVRPPEDVYRVLLYSFDGIDTVYRANYGDWSATWQAYYGNTKEDINSAVLGEIIETEAEDFTGINLTLSNDWLTLFGGYVKIDLTQSLLSPLEGLYQTLGQAGFQSLVDEFDTTISKKFDYLSLGAEVDYNDWLFSTEYTETSTDRGSFFLNDKAWFAMAGKRFGDYTWHITYSNRKEDPDYSQNTIPEGVNPGLTTLHNIFDSLFLNISDTSITTGVRFDYQPGVALKLDVSRYERDVAKQLYPGHESGLDAGTLIRASIDLVF